MCTPKVSIIIPAYNVEDYIGKCVKSVADQTLHETEIIVINDGSTDFTGDICQKLAETDHRIKYVETQNQGVGEARNIGMRNANADWLCFVDGDDYLPIDAIETLYSARKDADIVVGNYLTDQNGVLRSAAFFTPQVAEENRHSPLFLVGNSLGCTYYGANGVANIGVPWAKLYNRTFIGGGSFAN